MPQLRHVWDLLCRVFPGRMLDHEKKRTWNELRSVKSWFSIFLPSLIIAVEILAVSLSSRSSWWNIFFFPWSNHLLWWLILTWSKIATNLHIHNNIEESCGFFVCLLAFQASYTSQTHNMELDWHVISLKPLPKWKQSNSFLSPLCSQDV